MFRRYFSLITFFSNFHFGWLGFPRLYRVSSKYCIHLIDIKAFRMRISLGSRCSMHVLVSCFAGFLQGFNGWLLGCYWVLKTRIQLSWPEARGSEDAIGANSTGSDAKFFFPTGFSLDRVPLWKTKEEPPSSFSWCQFLSSFTELFFFLLE